jgi:hypothetical protein
MNIEANENGWIFDESTGWKLIHNDQIVIFFEFTDKSISTQEKLFIGTKEECEQYIVDNNLLYTKYEEAADAGEPEFVEPETANDIQ